MNKGLQKKVPIVLHEEWEAVKALPRGGQAAPILLQHRKNRERAVLKILKPPDDKGRFDRTEENKARLIREIGILQEISHPNIINLKRADPRAAPPWYVSPFGKPLKDYWAEYRKSKAPNELFDEAQRIVIGLLDGLKVFHEKSCVHRDIKPANIIMLDREGVLTPVLIDFGVAYVPDEPRITKTGDDPVANRFSAPPEALYGKMSDPPPWWDCLGIMWLWAWMLMHGRGPKFAARYASDYHIFIPDSRCKRVGYVWKIAEIEELGPKDASEMLSLLRSVGLDREQNMEPGETEGSFDAARTAWEEGKARLLAEGASTRKAISAAASLLGAIYDPLRERIKQLCEGARARGLPVDFLVRSEPSENLFLSHNPKGSETYLFEIRCGVPSARHFKIQLYASYVHPPKGKAPEGRSIPNLIPFAFTLLLRHDGSMFQDESVAYWHAANGEIRRYDMEWTQLDDDLAYKKTDEWLRNPRYWQQTV